MARSVILSEAKNPGSWKWSLTRPAAADECVAAAHPLPKGEGFSAQGRQRPSNFQFPFSIFQFPISSFHFPVSR